MDKERVLEPAELSVGGDVSLHDILEDCDGLHETGLTRPVRRRQARRGGGRWTWLGALRAARAAAPDASLAAVLDD